MNRVAIIGAGSWGTALSLVCARAGNEVGLWSRNAIVVDSINREHLNAAYLTGVRLPESVKATKDIAAALDRADLVIIAVPSHVARVTFRDIAPLIQPQMIFVSATKGIEIESGMRISQIAADALGEHISRRFVCLSGPSFAKEVVEGHPTAIVAAADDPNISRTVQSRLSLENLRVYASDDIVGVELGGAVKNVIAIAAGMVAGLGFGSNSVSALITRGLAEMARLALKEGARRETLMGLAGLGDLVLTCTGNLSRNRFVGHELGKGRSIEEITGSMKEVAEGVRTTQAAKRLAKRVGVEMPITNEVYAVLYEHKSAREAAASLMSRPLRDEFKITSASNV